MSKKFKFKLEGLLKLRKFREQEIKVELGNINREIQEIELRIIELQDHIESSYLNQESAMSDDVKGQSLQFFPYYTQVKREDIKNKEILLLSLRKKYQKKIEEMGKAMGDSKVVDKFKEKEISEYKNRLEKKLQDENEELVRRRFHYLNRRF